MKERYIEQRITEEAKKLNFLTYKFVSPSRKGVPDRIFITPKGRIFFIEFKTEKGKLTKLQEKTIVAFMNYKIDVSVVRNIEQGLEILKLNA